MQLSSVKLINKGTKGLKVSYMKPEVRGNMTFNHEYDVAFKVPVNPEIRKILMDMENHAKDMFVLKEEAELNVIGVISNEEKIQLEVEVNTYDGRVFNATSAMVDDTTEYKDYKRLNKLVVKLYDAVTTYINSNTVPKPKQLLMDFATQGSDKEKQELASVDIEHMSEEDAMQKAIQLLEKKGCLVMVPDEVEVIEP